MKIYLYDNNRAIRNKTINVYENKSIGLGYIIATTIFLIYDFNHGLENVRAIVSVHPLMKLIGPLLYIIGLFIALIFLCMSDKCEDQDEKAYVIDDNQNLWEIFTGRILQKEDQESFEDTIEKLIKTAQKYKKDYLNSYKLFEPYNINIFKIKNAQIKKINKKYMKIKGNNEKVEIANSYKDFFDDVIKYKLFCNHKKGGQNETNRKSKTSTSIRRRKSRK